MIEPVANILVDEDDEMVQALMDHLFENES